ncbi:MAG: epimerase [Chloroflexi bacterium RBG_16_56_11]|nr:MAG: epimerase [Chloroflexi bacterium RBG_16_56_11]
MKALVTGATGLIGSSIVRELLKDGVEVRAMVREKSDTRNIDGLAIERVSGDIRDAESMGRALKGIEVFYQAAALYTMDSPEKLYYDINVEGTKTALTAALKQGTPKVVYTSSIAAIGCTGTTPANEGTEWNWAHLGLPYVTTKYLGEQAALEFCKQGLPVVVVNPAGVIGVRDIKPTPTGQIILNVLNRKYPGYPDGGNNFVDVEDVARGHVLAAQKGRTGERYILGNTNMTFKDFFKLVAEVAGTRPLTMRLPAGLMITLGYTYQAISAITRKPPLLKPNSARFACETAFYNPSKAVNELGMPQTPLRTTVEKAVNWFRENGYVKAK